MQYRRSEFEKYLDILATIISGEMKPTRLLYRCNLNLPDIRRILGRLVSLGLIEDIGTDKHDKKTPRRYVITKRGIEVYRTLMGAYAVLELIPITEVPEFHEKFKTVRYFKPVEVK